MGSSQKKPEILVEAQQYDGSAMQLWQIVSAISKYDARRLAGTTDGCTLQIVMWYCDEDADIYTIRGNTVLLQRGLEIIDPLLRPTALVITTAKVLLYDFIENTFLQFPPPPGYSPYVDIAELTRRHYDRMCGLPTKDQSLSAEKVPASSKQHHWIRR